MKRCCTLSNKALTSRASLIHFMYRQIGAARFDTPDLRVNNTPCIWTCGYMCIHMLLRSQVRRLRPGLQVRQSWLQNTDRATRTRHLNQSLHNTHRPTGKPDALLRAMAKNSECWVVVRFRLLAGVLNISFLSYRIHISALSVNLWSAMLQLTTHCNKSR